MPQRESANLDLLRSLAVLLVTGSHFLDAFGLGSKIPVQLFSPLLVVIGHFGVMLFFIHTSLVLMMSLARLEQKPGPMVWHFYVRRLFRIYPAAIAVMLVIIAFRIPDGFQPYVPLTRVELWSNLALVQNVFHTRSIEGPLWSLPFELQMYAFLPFLYMVGRRYGRPAIFLGLGVGSWYVEHRIDMRLGWEPVLSFAPWFCMGIAAYFRRATRRLPVWLYVVSLAVLVISEVVAEETLGSRRAYGEWALGAAFCLMLPCFREIENPGARQVLRKIATYSYGMYLTNVPILTVALAGMRSPQVLKILSCVVGLIAVPVFLYHVVEEPFIRWGARLATRGLFSGNRRMFGQREFNFPGGPALPQGNGAVE